MQRARQEEADVARARWLALEEVRVLEEELVIDTTKSLATVLQDEFENSYTLPY